MLKIGDLFQYKYRILQVLGQGGSSIVYLSSYHNQLYTIKEMKKNFKVLGENEIEILSKLHHSHMPYLKEAFHLDTLYLVLNYIPGISLKKVVGLSNDEIIKIALQISKMMNYLHQRGILYLDLKPDNLIYDQTKVYLIDFGISQLEENRKDHLLGTRGFISPEMIETHQGSRQADIYAFGITLYILFTDQIPINSIDLIEDERIKLIIQKCIETNLLKRYQNFDEVIKDLKKLKRRNLLCYYKLKRHS